MMIENGWWMNAVSVIQLMKKLKKSTEHGTLYSYLESSNERKKERALKCGDKGEGRDPKPRANLGGPAALILPACLPRSDSLKREAMCILKLMECRARPSLRLFLASVCGEGRLVGSVRRMTLLTMLTGMLQG